MPTTRRAALAGVSLLAGLALLGTACGSSSKDDASSSSTTARSGGSSTTAAAAATNASTGQTITVPLQVDRSGSSGGGRVIVQASIGGGSPAPMLLDTGSSGVVVSSSVLGPEAQATSETDQVDYVGTSVNGVVTNATVSMGGLTTTGPIAVVSGQNATCQTSSGAQEPCSMDSAFGDGVQGVIGIGLSDGPSPASPNYSPLLQVAAPYNEGFVVQLPASGSGAGSLIVGPVSAPGNATSVPLVASTSPTYPNGAKAWAKDVQLCWVVGSASACGPTDLDIGSVATELTPSDLPGAPVTKDVVNAGTPVTVSPKQGAAPLWSFTAGTTVSQNLAAMSTGLGSATAFNTGIGFFFVNVVGFDSAHGQLLIWPQGT